MVNLLMNGLTAYVLSFVYTRINRLVHPLNLQSLTVASYAVLPAYRRRTSLYELWISTPSNVKSAFTSKRLVILITGCAPSAALMVKATVGLTDDSLYSPSARTSTSPAEALLTAVLMVSVPGDTLTVAAWSATAHRSAPAKERNCLIILA